MFKSSDYKESKGSSIPKILTPGTHYCRIIDVTIDVPAYNKEASFIVLKLEGKDMGNDFKGIDIDRNNPSLGSYRGQIASVKSQQYPFSDYVYNGKPVKRDKSMFNWINQLAKAMGVFEKMNEKGVEGETIEDYIYGVRKYLIDPELWGHFTIGGAEYFNEGYSNPNYRLFFPKLQGRENLFPFSAKEDENKNPINFIHFNEKEHIKLADDKDAGVAKESAKTVDSFEPTKETSISDDLSGVIDINRGGDTDLDLPFANS